MTETQPQFDLCKEAEEATKRLQALLDANKEGMEYLNQVATEATKKLMEMIQGQDSLCNAKPKGV